MANGVGLKESGTEQGDGEKQSGIVSGAGQVPHGTREIDLLPGISEKPHGWAMQFMHTQRLEEVGVEAPEEAGAVIHTKCDKLWLYVKPRATPGLGGAYRKQVK